jgi:hypothetical protein
MKLGVEARREALVALVAAVALAFAHRHELDVARFAALFIIIDVVGYLPGLLAHRASGGRPIAPVYYALYNGAHSFVTGAAVAAIWAVALRPEWALLAIPIHLLGDRALFGNFRKTAGAPFEPAREVTA